MVKPKNGKSGIGACLLLALGVLLTGAPARAADSGLSAYFQVYMGGFQVAKAEVRLGLYKDCFDLRLAAEPYGVVSYLSSFKLVTWADGCSDGAGVVPISYSADYFKNGRKKRWVRVDYKGASGPLVRAEPAPEDDHRKPVPSGLRAGSLDPLNTVFAIIEAVTREGRCQGERPVYDGRRLFRVTLNHVGSVVLPPSSYAAYAGDAIECLVRLETVAGFKKNEIRKKHFPTEVQVYLAEAVPGAPLFPVRLEADYRFGQIRVHAGQIVPWARTTEETRAR
ncbi:MAG: DUF3108 domain-containing protein [Kiloniellales bacterium]|nr:DUF3108 domain-containing protein [Kiloniellales bacterium]